MTRSWRWQPWWLALGAFAGAVWGAVLGATWMVVVSLDQAGAAIYSGMAGGMFGGLSGGATGLAVGTVLALVVGRDRPVGTARPLAAASALVATPAALVGVLVMISGEGVELAGAAPVLGIAAVAAAATSWWFAPKMADRPRVVSSA